MSSLSLFVRRGIAAPARRASRAILSSLLLLSTLACGGGSPAVSLSPGSLTFTSEKNGSLPTPQTVTAIYSGDGMLVGYPKGVEEPGWLQGYVASQNGKTCQVIFSVTTTNLAPGTYTTTVRFVTGKQDGSDIKYTDMPVTYVVTPGLAADVASLTFAAGEGGQPQPQSLTFSRGGQAFGWSLSAEAIGYDDQSWLLLSSTSGDSQGESVTVQVTVAPRPAGTYRAMLLLTDANGLWSATIEVTYEVTAGLDTDVVSLNFAAAEGTQPQPQSLTISHDGYAFGWSLSVQPVDSTPADWLSLSSTSGDSQGPSVTVQVSAAARPAGDYAATLVLANASGTPRATIPVAYHVTPPYALTGTLTAHLTASSSPGELSLPLTVQTKIGAATGAGIHWQVTSSAPWASVRPASGDLSADTSLVVHLDPTLVGALPDGTSQANLTLQVTESGYTPTTVPVSLTIDLPRVDHIAPYDTWVNRSEKVILRGAGFTGSTMSVQFGPEVATGSVISPTEIHVSSPPVASPTRVAVSIDNAIGVTRPSSEMVVLPEPGYAAADIPLDKQFLEMVLDPERQAVLLSGYQATEIQRVRFNDNAWSSDHFSDPNVEGVGVALDGKTLLATTGSSMADKFMQLDADTLALQKTTQGSDDYQRYTLVAALNDGRVMLINSNQWASTLWYPTLSAGPYPSLVSDAMMVQTRDRSRIILLNSEPGGSSSCSFDASGTVFTARMASMSYRVAGISQDGSRLVAGTDVYDRDFNLLGALIVPEWISALAVSPDGASVYTFGQPAGGSTWVLRRTAISAAIGNYIASATPIAFTLPSTQMPRQMAVSEDGSTLFVLSDANNGSAGHLFVVPLQ